MPKKIPEKLREEVVSLRKAGHTYTQIEKQVTNPETGAPLARPTTIKILREAGMTKSARAAVPTEPSPSGLTPSGSGSVVVQTGSPGDGVSEFMPKKPPARTTATKAEAIEFECDNCRAEFIADSEADLPDECPECGQ